MLTNVVWRHNRRSSFLGGFSYVNTLSYSLRTRSWNAKSSTIWRRWSDATIRDFPSFKFHGLSKWRRSTGAKLEENEKTRTTSQFSPRLLLFFLFFFFFYFTQIKILSTQEHWTSYPSSLPADMVGFLFEALVNQLLPCLILYGGSSFDILARCVTVSYQIILIYRILKAKRM